jgi:arsenate reductase (thioredoxin)
MLIQATLAAAVLAVAVPMHAGDPPSDGKKVVLFVCEHGAAKSVIAAARFNKRAQDKKIPYRAIAKGTDPQEELSEAALKGLQADGLAASPARPERLTAADVAAASRVVTLGCDISKVAPAAHAESWADVPPPSQGGYAATRDAIDRHMDALLAELEGPKK